MMWRGERIEGLSNVGHGASAFVCAVRRDTKEEEFFIQRGA